MEKGKRCSLAFSQRVRDLALGRRDRAEGVYVSWVPRSRVRGMSLPTPRLYFKSSFAVTGGHSVTKLES